VDWTYHLTLDRDKLRNFVNEIIHFRVSLKWRVGGGYFVWLRKFYLLRKVSYPVVT